MNQPNVSISVQTDKSEYTRLENVVVTVCLKQDGVPASQERVVVTIFNPYGQRAGRFVISSDSTGSAVAVYRLKRQDITGSYAVEAYGPESVMALNSFLVF